MSNRLTDETDALVEETIQWLHETARVREEINALVDSLITPQNEGIIANILESKASSIRAAHEQQRRRNRGKK